MPVYWESDERNNKGFPGRKQYIDFSFEYGGKRRYIPAIYRFPEGIIFDVLTLLDEAELRAFHEKYQDVEEALSLVQRQAVEDEHPYQSVPLWKIKINGKLPPDGWSSRSMHAPWMEEHLRREKEMKAYEKQLNGTSCFACDKYTIPLYPKPISKWAQLRQWLFPEKINRIEISISKKTRFLPIELTFILPRDFSKVHTETFLHPQTKIEHTLYFQSFEHEKMEVPTENDVKTLHVTQLSYEINPALSEDDHLQFCSSVQWEPEPVEMNEFLPQSTASVGIIGGADGPVYIFWESQNNTSSNIPCGIHGLPLHDCIAKPSFEEETVVHVVLEGVNVKWLDVETVLWEL